jgi:hypothetical protein
MVLLRLYKSVHAVAAAVTVTSGSCNCLTNNSTNCLFNIDLSITTRDIFTERFRTTYTVLTS